MCVPHRNNPPRVAARRPNHHHHPAVEIAGSDMAFFTIVFPVILGFGVIAFEDFPGVRETSPRLARVASFLAGSKVTFIYLL